jgi:hypothetical protein
MYQVDGGRQPLVLAFVKGGPDSLRPDKDIVTAVAGDSRTC